MPSEPIMQVTLFYMKEEMSGTDSWEDKGKKIPWV